MEMKFGKQAYDDRKKKEQEKKQTKFKKEVRRAKYEVVFQTQEN